MHNYADFFSSVQRKAFAVVDNILKSEAAFLTSLNIAVKVSTH